MPVDPSVISAVAAGICTGVGGFFWKKLQEEVKRRPTLEGHEESLNRFRRRTVLLRRRLEKAEANLIDLEKDVSRLNLRVHDLERNERATN